MGLDAIVRSAVATANRVTGSLQCSVSHEAYASQNSYGEPTYSAAVTRTAVVDYKPRMVTDQNGQEVLSATTLTLLGDVTVTNRDRFTLPGGLTAPVLSFGGVMDPTTSRPYATVVYLGGGA